MKHVSRMMIAAVFLSGTAWAEISLPYGKSDGQVSYLNQKNQPNAEDLYPTGPNSFRVDGDGAWIADSVAGRILRVAGSGKVFAIPVGTMKNGFLEDLALVRDAKGNVVSLWVLRGDTQQAVHLGLDGKKIASVGGQGDAPGKFQQAVWIEVGPTGHVYVADRARRKIAIFDPKGTLLREIHWEWSGLAVNPAGNLCHLKWDPRLNANHLVVETPDGKPVKDTVLEIGDHTNPVLWSVDASGEAVVTFIPPEGFKGKYKIARCRQDGKPAVVADLVPPKVMNRFLDRSAKGALFLGVAGYDQAPAGAFKIEPFLLK